MSDKPTRGETNFNPGNLEWTSTPWHGQIGTDGPFVKFDTPANGIRALAIDLRNQQDHHGLNTVREIIMKFAPPSENNTAAYIAAVSSQLGVAPDDILDLHDADTLTKFVKAIIQHEQGRCIYGDATISNSVELALA